ncbi:MAG: hypothetical protein IJV97_03230 [Alphaproteobacteria bacterium]|nr:hypothetical protein [Alphaproteobacteria bacterium]
MSSRYTNMWGEDLEEQQKRREWLRQVYDNAVKSSVVTQVRNTYNQALDTADKLNQDNTINNDNYKHYSDIIQDGIQDLKADARGIYVGFKNPDEDCEDMISQFYSRYIK